MSANYHYEDLAREKYRYRWMRSMDAGDVIAVEEVIDDVAELLALLGEARNWVQDPELRARIKAVAPPEPRR